MMTWRNGAACADESPELFFPIGNTYFAHLQVEKAKAVCRRCEVVDSCLTWAIESGQPPPMRASTGEATKTRKRAS